LNAVEISVVCPVTRHAHRLDQVHRAFHDVLERTGRSVEFIYVFDGPYRSPEKTFRDVPLGRFPVRLLTMAKGFGEATALTVAFQRVSGRFVLTIPDRLQIDPSVIETVLDHLDRGDPFVVTRREPRTDAWLNRLQGKAFHWLVQRVARRRFNDMSCGVRGMTVDAARKLDLYGDQHRFIPLIASRLGYEVVEVPGAQHEDNSGLRLRRPGVYARRLLDILNIYFLTRFTRKPLRFFGLIGLVIGAVGFVISAWLAIQRLVGNSALADRPLLLLGVLLIVLGAQMTSIGLLGEIIIFLSPKREAPEVAEIVEGGGEGEGGTPETADRVGSVS
jgi:glycosyltransferase involved in cell wall biosynthesis